MANSRFTSELLDEALFDAREPTDGTSDYENEVVRYCNRAYRAIQLGGSEFDKALNEEWWWLRSALPGVITLQPRLASGTIAVTNASATATFSGVPTPAIDSDVTGWYLKVDDRSDIFRISSIASTLATLDSVYTGDTDATATFRLFKLDYTLATTVLRVMSKMAGYADGEYAIEGMEEDSMKRDYPLALTEAGMPTAFAHIGEREVRFNRYGGTANGDLRRIDFDFLERPADLTDSASEEPVIPLEYRHLLADATAYFLLLEKDDDRAAHVLQRVQGGLGAMAKEHRARINRLGDLRGKIQPRQGHLNRFRGPIRTNSGMIIG